MAVNLLLLANQLRGNLQNGSSGSRTRTSYQNQPGNLKRGTHIPGTNLKEDQGIRTVARKGRKGDSELRRVGGEVSHVNTTEANAIDMLGPMGEAWVQSVGSGTTNPKTGLREYGFGSWLKKRVTPPKKVREAVQSGLDIIQEHVPGAQAIADKWDKGELGMTSLMAKNIKADTVWKPSEGKWGPFGQTKKSKERDKAAKQTASRKNSFDDFRRKYENENIAGIMTESPDDDSTRLTDYTGNQGLKDFVIGTSGLNNPSGTVTGTDVEDYTDYYDEGKEQELVDTRNIQTERFDTAGDKIDLQKREVNSGAESANKGIGSQLSSGLFGMLTQSSDTTAAKGFAGAGDFAADFAKTKTIEAAQQQFEQQAEEKKFAQEDIALTEDSLQTDKDEADQALVSGVKDLHDNYNQEFWENMMSWDTAINS
jgi:NACalpha-BTF3-like transcription factor